MKTQPRQTQKPDPRDAVRAIRHGLDAHTHCVAGLLFWDRVVATQHGGLSHEYPWGLSTK